jgi:hypothetical protein
MPPAFVSSLCVCRPKNCWRANIAGSRQAKNEHCFEERMDSLSRCILQVEEIMEISVLAKDAAEILWEMVAMGESGSAVADMESKAEQLQVGAAFPALVL